MDRLEEIKNEVAKELGCKDYETLINEEGDDLINTLLNLSAKRYARECSKASLHKAAWQSAEINMYDGGKEETYRNHYVGSVYLDINKDSIESEKNIVLV